MDELDVLKKDWQLQKQEFPKLSYSDIYKMLLKKSSSIVKWIFYISILEMLFWIGLILILPDSFKEVTEQLGLTNFVLYGNIVHFLIFIGFIYYFHKNYRAIEVTDNTKSLMSTILKTRKTVRYFVYYNIGMFIISSIVTNFIYYSKSEQLYGVLDIASTGVPQENFALVFIVSQIIIGILFVGVLMLFYWLVYGLLLGKLKRNYHELRKMEV